MAAAHSGVNQGWLLGFSWNTLEGIKHSIPVDTQSESREADLEGPWLKIKVRGMSEIKFLKPFQSALEYLKTLRWNGTSLVCTHFDWMFTSMRQWSEEPRGEQIECVQVFGEDVRKRSRRLGVCPVTSGTRVGPSMIWESSYARAKLWQYLPSKSVVFEWISHSLWWMLKYPQIWIDADGWDNRIVSIFSEILSNIETPSFWGR